jgi:hypothetical protein
MWLYDGCVLVLHYPPAAAPLHNYKGPDVTLRALLDSVRRHEGAHDAWDSSNRHIETRKSDVHALNSVGRTLQERLVRLTYRFQGRLAASISPP